MNRNSCSVVMTMVSLWSGKWQLPKNRFFLSAFEMTTHQFKQLSLSQIFRLYLLFDHPDILWCLDLDRFAWMNISSKVTHSPFEGNIWWPALRIKQFAFINPTICSRLSLLFSTGDKRLGNVHDNNSHDDDDSDDGKYSWDYVGWCLWGQKYDKEKKLSLA